jgi:hypothetical protein
MKQGRLSWRPLSFITLFCFEQINVCLQTLQQKLGILQVLYRRNNYSVAV